MIKAEMIKDSVSPAGIRLPTMKVRYPKFIHGEFMTHRVFSRNASSSRAVPTSKLIEEVRSDVLRAAPVFWGKNQKGMQAVEEFEGDQLKRAMEMWRFAAQDAASRAEEMLSLGVHKQIVNRLLEPFSHINVVVTATEWDNFFGLRLHKDAQPEMRALAEAMWRAHEESIPEEVLPGEWHLPFVGHHDIKDALAFSEESMKHGHWFGRWAEPQEVLLWVSTARCARVSYESFETSKPSTIQEDINLFLRLLGQQPLHASPAEHQATPDVRLDTTAMNKEGWEHPEQHRNLRGWRQHRAMIPGEAKAPLPEAYR